jgi:chemotaxis protein methyltransferase CheR
MKADLQQTIGLPRGGFELLRDLVHERTGLYFDDAKTGMFLDKLSPLLGERGSDSFLEFFHFLKYDSNSAAVWRKVFDALTVQESFFWREMEQIRALVDEIVPRYLKAHPNDTLNIWSAACATGCEPLTIAMALNEAGWFDRAAIKISASDASPRAIEAAYKGVYREHSFRRLPPALKEKYFSYSGGTGAERLSKVYCEIHSRIRWEITNLMSEADLASAPMTSPVIFCRNVFIYFSKYAARKTVRAFAGTMPSPGYLFVGMAESLMNVSSDFALCGMGDAFIHVRR